MYMLKSSDCETRFVVFWLPIDSKSILQIWVECLEEVWPNSHVLFVKMDLYYASIAQVQRLSKIAWSYAICFVPWLHQEKVVHLTDWDENVFFYKIN